MKIRLVCFIDYNSDFLNPIFSNNHFDGQNLVQTPTCNIDATNKITYQFCKNNPVNNTIDIKKYTALTEVIFIIVISF